MAYKPVRNSKRLIALISAIGMSIFLQNYVSLTQGSRDLALPSLVTGQWVLGESNGFAATISTMQLIIWLVTFPGDAGADAVYPLFAHGPRLPRLCGRPEDGQPAGHQH